MTAPEKALWQQFADEFPWLGSSDRYQLKILCQQAAQYEADPTEFGFNRLNMIRQMLNSMGGSPADRSKVSAPDGDEEDDPAAKYLQ